MDRYEAVFDSLEVPMALVQPDGVVVALNRAWRQRLAGAAASASLSAGDNLLSHWEALHPRASRVRTALREIASGARSGVSVAWPGTEGSDLDEALFFRIRRTGQDGELMVSVEGLPRAGGALLRDPATGCLTREAFRERTAHALDLVDRRLARARSGQLLVLALRFVGLEHVDAEVDARLGRRVRRALADRLRDKVRRADALAWLGGDAFAIAPVGIDHRAADRLEAGLHAQTDGGLDVEGRTFRFPLRVARSAYPEDGSTVESLVYQAVNRARAPQG